TDKLERFLRDGAIDQENYISKNHIHDKLMRELLFKNPNVRIFNIRRDLRDVLVSAYHHHRRNLGLELSFEDYFAVRGQAVARRVIAYHQFWEAPQSPRYFVSSYEGLHENFDSEVIAMANF